MRRIPTTGNPRYAVCPREGYTIIELVVVILILGILAAVAAPRYGEAVAWHRAEAAAKRVRNDLALARHNAKLTSASRTVTFTVGSDQYVLSGIDDPDHPSSPYSVRLTDTRYPASLVSATFGGNSSVTFDRYGRPDNGGTVSVQAGVHQKIVVVNATTGRATIQ